MATDKPRAAGQTPPPPAGNPVAPSPVAPLFRRIDWLACLITAAAVWLGYYLTLAPEVTLEDSGELATGSFYAGIPHSPGYPVWTLYTWLWTVLAPFKNIAWRVALGEATSGAVAAGLLGLLVSRGSSLLIEGVEELKAVAGRWEGAICVVSGFVAGMLLGYNGFMWSQSVIVEVYSFSVLSLMIVLLCLLRWIYAPQQRRYLYYSLFFFGLCFTNHQTLIVAAMGIEAAIAAADSRMGRNLFLGNSIIYLGVWLLSAERVLTALAANPAVFVIFHVVGVCSLVAYGWLAFLTKERPVELVMDGVYAAFWIFLAAMPALGVFGALLALAALAGFLVLAWQSRGLGGEWLVILLCGLCWVAGAAFYFYMPLACMSNPPMQWSYPRTADGFIHALTRGQYEKTHPTDIIHHPEVFGLQLLSLGRGILEEFNWVYAFLALIPFLFFRKYLRRERAWLIGIVAIYLCLGILLLILLNPPPDRNAQQLVRVFFTASHTCIALLVGYGLTLTAAFMAAHYDRFRPWGLRGGMAAVGLAALSFTEMTRDTFFGEDSELSLPRLLAFVGKVFSDPNQYGLPVYAGLILLGLTLVFVGALLFYRRRAPLGITLVLFAMMPAHSILTHWSDNEQRNHWFGYWYGHDMFSPPFQGADHQPLYPSMARDAILFGGTDAGRFCPTYMIFCESFIPHHCQPAEDRTFDRRDVYIITQNALADPPYLNYIRAQYNHSKQVDPPFFQDLFRLLLHDKESQTNFLARSVEPLDRFFTRLGRRIEKRRRTSTSWFRETDFLDLPAFAARLGPGPRQDALSKYLCENLTPALRAFLGGKADDAVLRRGLARDLNRLLEREQTEKKTGGLAASGPLYQPERFKGVPLSASLADFIKENPQGDTRIRLNRLLLEAAYPKELARSLGGVYPDREINTPPPSEALRCTLDYMADARRRLRLKQLEPGEDVVELPDGKVQINGQVSVMTINGQLTKILFDQNPGNEFYVEESAPIKWMYPYLTPFGIIMKLNRQPPAEITEDMVRRDHEFWTRYSERLIGNWITYDTSIQDIVAWAERVYQRRDFTGFKGDRRFVRDDQAQKVFSKLRGAIAGIYNYRAFFMAKPPAEQQRLLKETEFALRQAFAFCPYNIEVVGHYIQFLANFHRFDDALLIANTCLELDPNNAQVAGIIKTIQTWKSQAPPTQAPPPASPEQALRRLEQAVQADPTNFQAAFDLAATHLQLQQTNQAVEILDRVLNSPWINHSALDVLAQAYAQIQDLPRLQAVLDKAVKLYPDSPEAWYNLAGLQASLGNSTDAPVNLRRALELNALRLKRNPAKPDLAEQARKDPRLAPLLQRPDFQQWLTPASKPPAK
ncbi:MAG: protein O-mannosyl-transferase family [Limisphaerales bacterium]